MSPAEFEARAMLWFNLRAAAHRYYAQPLEIDTHLFAAQPADAGDAGDPSNGWSGLLGNRLQVHPVGGDHWSIMMDAERAGRVGGAIASCWPASTAWRRSRAAVPARPHRARQ